MSWAGRSAHTLLAVVAAVSAAGCTAGGSSSDAGEESCVYLFTYEGREYRDIANVNFVVADKLGTAVNTPCDDQGGEGDTKEPGTSKPAYAVNGISPKIAIAVGDTPAEAKLLVSYSGSELPPEIQKPDDGS
ncbi:DUF6281 family protein [Streptomyces yaizuensis]|uniref:DUF6281 family protein n=1 Tax=Streptomyces yaizuensis TaxID=2989713 RepID=A0ABQ5NYD3_9ACTN|nr:DUF6281 family protein [Streptomyces sp. YSPA8]GLF95168.1 DUF6281 family protein [Streptomyces sp. YSPA8]